MNPEHRTFSNVVANYSISCLKSVEDIVVNETQLIEKLRQQDPEAQRAFFEIHVDRVFRLTFRMTGDKTLADDYTQETFIRAFERIDQFAARSALGTWLHAIAVSIVLNGMRKLKRRRQHEIETDLDFERIGPADDSPARQTTVGNSGLAHISSSARISPFPDLDLKRWLHRAIDSLEDDLRIVFVMHDIEGYKHREISKILELPVGTTKTRLFRARQQLREELISAGFINFNQRPTTEEEDHEQR